MLLFHVFCEFADGSSRYLHLKSSSLNEAYQRAKREYYASQVLWIISSLDPFCKSLGLEYTPRASFDSGKKQARESKIILI